MPTTPSYLGVPYPYTTYTQYIGGARGRRRVSNVQLQARDSTERALTAHYERATACAVTHPRATSWRPSRRSGPPRSIRDKARLKLLTSTLFQLLHAPPKSLLFMGCLFCVQFKHLPSLLALWVILAQRVRLALSFRFSLFHPLARPHLRWARLPAHA